MQPAHCHAQALGGILLGYSLIGPLGAVLGLGAGLMAGGSVAERVRFYRG